MPKKPDKPPTVESIMDECRAAMRKGLGKKRLSKAASDYWETNHEAAIKKHLGGGADWLKDRAKVVPIARKLGKVAAALTDKGMVLKWAAEAAHEAVKRDPGCPLVGGGGYCDF
jgi:hypothetical protein